jgi:hypothetical protein
VTGLPADLVRDLAAPAQPRDQALLLLTVDEALAAPRVALLSRAEVHVVNPDRLLVASWSGSRSAANLERTGTATLFWLAGAAVSVTLRRTGGEVLAGPPGDRELHAHVLDVTGVRADEVGYAELVAPLTFALHAPEDVLPRWAEVGARLAELADRLGASAERNAGSS